MVRSLLTTETFASHFTLRPLRAPRLRLIFASRACRASWLPFVVSSSLRVVANQRRLSRAFVGLNAGGGSGLLFFVTLGFSRAGELSFFGIGPWSGTSVFFPEQPATNT